MKKYKFVLKVSPVVAEEGAWRGEVWLNDNYIILLEDYKTEQDLWIEFFNIETNFIYYEMVNKKLFEAFFSKDNFLLI